MQTCMWIGNHFTSRGCISTAMAALISHPHTHRVTLVMRKTEKVGYDGCWRQSGGKALKLGQRESQGSKIYLKQHAGFCCCRRRCCLFCLDIIWFVFFSPSDGEPSSQHVLGKGLLPCSHLSMLLCNPGCPSTPNVPAWASQRLQLQVPYDVHRSISILRLAVTSQPAPPFQMCHPNWLCVLSLDYFLKIPFWKLNGQTFCVPKYL